MENEQARRVAADWLEAWNRHDLEAILSHYAEDVDFTSPFVAKIAGEPSGNLRGKKALREFFTKALAAYPDLNFKPMGVYAGVSSLVVHYESVNGKIAAEWMELDKDGKVSRVTAHYKAEAN